MLKNESPARIEINIPKSIDKIRQYTFPVLREHKNDWNIEFYAYDPLFGKLRRKRIKINHIHNIKARRKYARQIIDRITQQLIEGWNPWIESDLDAVVLFKDVCDLYNRHNEKMYKEGYFRKGTYQNHMYHLKRIIEYNERRVVPITYIYQMDLRFCNDMLDDVFINQQLSGAYRNSMLQFMKLFFNFCIERGFTAANPAMNIKPIPRALLQKRRKVIPSPVVREVTEWIKKNDKHFMLSCYLLYYCFIRPIEQTRLKIGYFNLKESTLTIPALDSKNRSTQTVTVPRIVLEYALDLKVFTYKPDAYLFSENLEPGYRQISERWLTEHWIKVKKALSLDKDYTFYSLKDTGITEMLNMKVSNLAVRDQARHSSLSITNIYAQHLQQANKEIVNLEGSL